MAEKFGEIFSNSWKEFKLNFKNFFLILLFLSFIPSIVFFIFEIFLMKDFFNLMASGTLPSLPQIISVFLGINGIVLGIIIIACIFIGVWFQSSLFYFSLYKKKSLSLGKILTGGAKYYWKLFGLMIVMFLVFFLPILVLGIIIAAIAFLGGTSILSVTAIVILTLLIVVYILYTIYLGVRWLFSFYALVGENKGIVESLKGSGKLVKRKWWRTFGYSLLFLLIIYAISILFSIPSMIINFIISLGQLSSGVSSSFSGLFVVTMVVSFVFNLLSQIIIIPLCVLFFKNFYLERKKGSKK